MQRFKIFTPGGVVTDMSVKTEGTSLVKDKGK